jgi:mono/diheme cytochrome c family protein
MGGHAMRAKLLSALLCLAAVPALAAGDPDAVRGLLVERCADCHAVPGYRTSTPATGLPAPAFKVMANEPEVYPEERLRAFLQRPHWPMSGFILSPSDIDNILAYLTTLRQK